MLCLTGTDACSSNPCLNGATCKVVASEYSCTCAYGYTGTTCQTRNINSLALFVPKCYCTFFMFTHWLTSFPFSCADRNELSICLSSMHAQAILVSMEPRVKFLPAIKVVADMRTDNPGTRCRTRNSNTFHTLCFWDTTVFFHFSHFQDYWKNIPFHALHMIIAMLCLTGNDACSSNPCLNGATCKIVASGYSCTCAYGYTGTTCQTRNISSLASFVLQCYCTFFMFTQ